MLDKIKTAMIFSLLLREKGDQACLVDEVYRSRLAFFSNVLVC